MLRIIFRGLAYLYVALALAPLVLLTVAIGVNLALGRNFFPLLGGSDTFAVIAPQSTAIDNQGPLVSFQTSALRLSKEGSNSASATDFYALGVSHVGPQTFMPPNDSAMIASSGDWPYVDQTMAAYDASPYRIGQFDNVLILDKRNGEAKPVFDKRISVRRFQFVASADRSALLIFGAEQDTNKDGELNAKDIQGLYAVTLDDGIAHLISGIVGSVVTLDQAQGADILLVRATLDQNKDGTASVNMLGGASQEPQRLYRVDLKSLTATPVVSAAVIDKLQHAMR